jgi:PAS domain S-box-containing protein
MQRSHGESLPDPPSLYGERKNGPLMTHPVSFPTAPNLAAGVADLSGCADQFRTAIDTIPGLVWTALPDGYIDFLNERWLDYTGLTLEQASGWGWQSAVCPDDLPRLAGYWRSMLESGKPGEIEARLRRHDGVDRWFLFRGVPQYDNRGSVIKWYGQTTDIEDRKHAEEELKRQTAHLDELFELAPHAVVLVDANVSVIRVNKEFTRMFGYTQEESVNRPLLDLVAPEERLPEYQNNARMLSSGQKVESETIRRRKDGVRIHVSMTAAPVLTEGPIEGYIIYRDITERKRDEEELKKQTAHLDELFELAPHAVVLVDADVRVMRVNEEFIRMFGYSAEEAVGRLLQDLVAPEECMAEYQNNARMLSSGQKVESDTIRRRKDGARLSVSMTASPVLTAGPIEGYIIYRDITQRKRDEALLAGETRLLEMIAKGDSLPRVLEALCRLVEKTVAGSLCSVLLVDSTGRRLQAGAAPSLPLEYTQSIDGRVIELGIGPCGNALIGKAAVITSDFGTDDSWSEEYRTLCLAHGLRACWSTPILSLEGNALGTFALYYREPRTPTPEESHIIEQFRDIASIAIERTEAENALRRSEAYLAEAQRLSQTGSFSWRPATDTHTWSEETYRIYQLDPAVKPTLELVRSRIHPADLAFFEIAKRTGQEGKDFAFEHRLLLPDGSIKHVQIVAHRVQNEAGEPMEFVGAAMDITERKRAEDALDNMRLDLAHVSRISTLGQMAASIAHEINQPLAGIVLNGNASLRWLAGDPPHLEEAREATRRIVRDGQRAGDVITRLRSLFRRESTPSERLAMNDVIQEVIAITRGEVQKGGANLQIRLSPDLPFVTGDRVQLQQLMLNLIMNAVEAMGEVEDRPREILISTQRGEENAVQVAVQDSGVGLDPQRKEKLFDAFYTSKSVGMGMGLAISRSIVEHHGGRLWAVSNDGPGATFLFTIPSNANNAA